MTIAFGRLSRTLLLVALFVVAAPAVVAQVDTRLDLKRGLPGIDLCQAMSAAMIEKLLLSKPLKPGQTFNFDGTENSPGCQWDGGKLRGETAFAYVAVVPIALMRKEPAVARKAVTALGKAAFFNNGADARALWVQIDDRYALLLARGDRPNESGLLEVARAMLPRFAS